MKLNKKLPVLHEEWEIGRIQSKKVASLTVYCLKVGKTASPSFIILTEPQHSNTLNKMMIKHCELGI